MSLKLLRQVCAETGASRRAIQGYEQAGLVSAAGKNKYGYLLYDDAGTERIRTIRFLQRIGLSIRDIQRVIDAPPAAQRRVLLGQLEQLERRSRELSDLIRQLRQYITTL